MNELQNIWNNVSNLYSNEVLTTETILTVLLMVTMLSIYEFIIYRVVSKKHFYSKSFNITIAVIPFFIATIILSLQSSLVITLGTIGALAIIRFRTAIKDPVDMVYILWAVHIGITCGCSLFELAVLTSLIVTVVLFVLDNLSLGKAPHILVVHCKEIAEEQTLIGIVKKYSKRIRVKSRNYTNAGLDIVIELSVKNTQPLTSALAEMASVDRYSLLSYDSEDIL